MNKLTNGRWMTRLLVIIIGITLTVVIISPVALSSQDLVKWASDPNGLGLTGVWPYVTFISLDCAAVLCIALTMHAYYKGEAAGMAHTLVWVFAGMSAFANWRQTLNTPALDDNWFLPSMSLLGAVLLEVVIRKLRRSARADMGVFENPMPRFRFLRWLVAFRETKNAWKLSVIEGISNPADAVKMARGQAVPVKAPETDESLTALSKAEAIRRAFSEIGSYEALPAIEWLRDRGVSVNRSHVYNIAKTEKATAALVASAVEVSNA